MAVKRFIVQGPVYSNAIPKLIRTIRMKKMKCCEYDPWCLLPTSTSIETESCFIFVFLFSSGVYTLKLLFLRHWSWVQNDTEKIWSGNNKSTKFQKCN